MGVFTYSPEEGTPAQKYAHQVTDRVKARRLDELMSIQREIAFAKNNFLIGRTIDVIIDSLSQDGAVGRSRGDCPEIDQEITVRGEDLQTGQLCRITIEAADGYDLRGRKVGVIA